MYLNFYKNRVVHLERKPYFRFLKGLLFHAKILYFFCAKALFRIFYLNLQGGITYFLKHMINNINKKVLYREIMDYVMIAVGMFSYAIGWMIFLLPNHIGNGGVAGFASIVNWGQGIPVSYTYFVLNAILLAVALKILGWKFCVRTIYGVVILTILTRVLGSAFPHPMLLHGQPFMSAIIGAVFCGVGLAFGLSYNGSSGGSDIVAAIVNKYRDISLGRVILLVDMTIVTGSYLVLHSWEQVIYGYVNLIITSFVLDQVISSSRRSVQFLIILRSIRRYVI